MGKFCKLKMSYLKKRIYSYSKLKTFEQCKLKYKLKYIDKIPPKTEKSIEAHLGSSVHDSLEWLYREVKKGRIPKLDELIMNYSQNWLKNYNSNMLIVKKDMTAKDYFNKGVQYLIDYYNTHTPFKDKTLDLEKEIFIDLSEEHKLRGFIDRLVYNPDTDEYEIHDYKTSNSAPSKQDIENDTQLPLYSLAIKEMVGYDKDIKLIWHYLSHNKKVHSKKTNEQLKQLKKETLELIKFIEATTEFPSNKTQLCDWCEYKPICPTWQNQNLDL